MLAKQLRDLTVDDIKLLTGVAESMYLDFKSAPVGKLDKDKREFLADVTAFANAAGGDLVFGVSTRDGVAAQVEGIELDDPDKEKLRLGDIIRSGAEPRLSHFDMLWLPTIENRGFLVLRVPRSWMAPHRVTLQGHDKFYVRNSAGKHPMNVDELRRAFTLAEAVADRVRGFRTTRVSALLSDSGPFPDTNGPKLIQHIVPLSSFVDPVDLKPTPESTLELRPLGVSGYNWQYCLDGLAVYNNEGSRIAYTLIFRNGIVEMVNTLRTDGKLISVTVVEQLAIEGLQHYRRFSRHHAIEPPIYHFLTLTSVKGLGTYLPERHSHGSSVPLRHDLLTLPEAVIPADTETAVPPTLLRPVFDRLANAFGLPASFNYSADGQYGRER